LNIPDLPHGEPALQRQGIVVADLNRDGRPDLVVSSPNGTVAVLLGGRDGSFHMQQTFTFAPDHGLQSVAVADLNNDGKPDLVVIDGAAGQGTTLLGVGDGSFRSQQTFTFAPDRGIEAVAVADLNNDGKPDLVLIDPDAGKVSLLMGGGDGSFQPQQTFAFAPDRGTQAVSVGDLNGDGRPDLLLLNPEAGKAGIQLSTPDGSFRMQQTFTFAPDRGMHVEQVADLNLDDRGTLLGGR
jgi:hypothetical protein